MKTIIIVVCIGKPKIIIPLNDGYNNYKGWSSIMPMKLIKIKHENVSAGWHSTTVLYKHFCNILTEVVRGFKVVEDLFQRLAYSLLFKRNWLCWF